MTIMRLTRQSRSYRREVAIPRVKFSRVFELRGEDENGEEVTVELHDDAVRQLVEFVQDLASGRFDREAV